MLGLARTAQIAGWAPTGPANARRTGTASTNASVVWTASGVTVSTAQAAFGTGSWYGTTNGSNLFSEVNTTFMNYGTGEFCIEWWFYLSSMSGHGSSSDLLANDNAAGGFGIRLAKKYNDSGLSSADPKYINIFARQQADLDYWTLDSNWTTGQWYFCALQRKGTTMSFWRNGILQTNSGYWTAPGGTRNFTSSTSTKRVRIGNADGSNGVAPNSYIDEICFSNTYRYEDTTSNIPVPTEPFTVDSYTTQLLHMDGTNGSTTFTNATS